MDARIVWYRRSPLTPWLLHCTTVVPRLSSGRPTVQGPSLAQTGMASLINSVGESGSSEEQSTHRSESSFEVMIDDI